MVQLLGCEDNKNDLHGHTNSIMTCFVRITSLTADKTWTCVYTTKQHYYRTGHNKALTVFQAMSIKLCNRRYCIYLNARRLKSKMNHKKKMSAKKKYLTITFIRLIHKAHHILSLPFSSFIFLTITPNIAILLPAIPQHITISPIHYIGYAALFKTLHSHVWWDVLPGHYDSHWLNFTFIFLCL